MNSLQSLQHGFDAFVHQSFGELKRNIVITPDEKYVYFSIPKCGCSSVKVFLRVLYGQSLPEAQSNPHSTENTPFIVLDNAANVNDKIASYVSSQDTFAFSVIRDPRQRVLSGFLNKFEYANDESKEIFGKQLFGVSNKNALALARELDFIGFLSAISKQEPRQMNEHWRPMKDQMLRLENSINVFTLDNISFLFKKVLSEKSSSSLSRDFRFTPHSTGSKDLIKTYFSDEAESLFNAIYKDDIDLYCKASQVGHSSF